MGSIRFAVTVLTLATVFTLASGHFFAHARLGDSRGDLVGAEGRYGGAIGETVAVLKMSLEKVDMFENKKVGIKTEYDADGKVWRITYTQKDMPDRLMESLLKLNGGERKWSKVTKYRDNKHWISEDKQLHAVYYGNPVYEFIIMTGAAANAERIEKTLESDDAIREDESLDNGTEETEKKSVDPLEGF